MVVTAGAVLLASLALVAWRQGRARDRLARLETLRHARVLAEARVGDLVRRLHRLESRSRVVPAARRELDMYVPQTSEIVILPGGPREEPRTPESE